MGRDRIMSQTQTETKKYETTDLWTVTYLSLKGFRYVVFELTRKNGNREVVFSFDDPKAADEARRCYSEPVKIKLFQYRTAMREIKRKTRI